MPKNSSEFKKFERENYLIEIDKDGLIYIEFVRNIYKKNDLNKVIEETQNLLTDTLILMSNNIFDEYRVIVDYTAIINTDFFPLQARKAFFEIISSGNIKKIAIFSKSKEKVKKTLVMIFKAMDVLISSCKMEMFTTKKAALKWINE